MSRGPEYYNRMNQLFDAGARRLGWHSEGVPQARRGCVKSAIACRLRL